MGTLLTKLIIAFCVLCYSSSFAMASDWNYCKTDEECVAVYSCGVFDTINRKYKKEHNDLWSRISCTSGFYCSDFEGYKSTIKCINEKCVGEKTKFCKLKEKFNKSSNVDAEGASS